MTSAKGNFSHSPSVSKNHFDNKAYSLKAGSSNSDAYFSDIALFADYWSAYLHTHLKETVDQVLDQRDFLNLPTLSFDEVCLEMLALGINILEHGDQAESTPAWLLHILDGLYSLRERYARFEAPLDLLRGWLGGYCLNTYRSQKYFNNLPESLSKLIQWMKVFALDSQALRLSGWGPYFSACGVFELKYFLDTCRNLVYTFSTDSENYLKKYTASDHNPIEDKYSRYAFQYDSVLRQSSAIEYRLGFLGTEILNRVYRKKFQQSHSRLIILPPCLRRWQNDSCQATQTPLGAQCSACHPDCKVNQITQKAARLNIPVVMIPDDSLKKTCVSSGQAGSGLGVIGAACALRNWCAGWAANELGLNAQGIILDNAGCRKHWSKCGNSTDVNMDRLFSLLEF